MIKYVRNLHRSANLFFEKHLCSAKDCMEYRDLLPIDDIQNGNEYLKALYWAFKHKRVKNVALTGPYGAGKSSVVDSFLRKHWWIKRKSLRISMASFEINPDVSGTSKSKTPISQENIEHGILKQLFYKVGYRKIPQSRYRKLHKVNAITTWLKLVLVLLLAAPFIYIFKEEFVNNTIEKITTTADTFGLSNRWSVAIFVVLILAILGIISYTYKSLLSRYRIRKVSFPSDTVVEGGTKEDESVFSKYIDEILYFFEVTKYRYVFFEDLDRLDNPSIFVHLRELNTLLNNYEKIHGKIKFVYTVKDDIFQDEDRTKFFDFIIPIIPIINSTNSGEVFAAMLRESEIKGVTHNISQGFILDVSPYISDMRVLQNIYNEFIVYKGTIHAEQGLEVDDEKMMALIIFKNLYPSEFADLQRETGVIKQAFEDKRAFIMDRQRTVQEEMDRLSYLIEKAETDALHSIKELKASFLCEITDWKGTAYYFSLDNSKNIYADALYGDTFDFLSVMSSKSCRGSMNNFQGQNRHFRCRNFSSLCEIYLCRFERVKLIENREVAKTKYELAALKKQQQAIGYKLLKDLLAEFEIDKVLSEEVKENKLLTFLLRRGYLDEDYANYINYFKGTSITKSDMNFVLAVKNLTRTEFEYPLTKISQVIQKLQPYEFQQKSVYNFALLDQLLDLDEETTKLTFFMEQLADEDEVSWTFIDGFVDVTKHQEKFIQLLAKTWNRMWLYIFEHITLSYERKVYYMSLLIQYVDIHRLTIMNLDKSISSFFEDHDDSLQQLASLDVDKICLVIHRLDIKFNNVLLEGVPNEIVEPIIEENRYGINPVMLKRIVVCKNSELGNDIDSRPYSTLVELGCDSILQYIRNNISEFIEQVISRNDMNDSEGDVVDLLSITIDDAQLYHVVLAHERIIFEDIFSCYGELISEKEGQINPLWNLLLENDKICLSWENIYGYWEVFGFTDELLKYVEKHAKALSNKNVEILDDNIIREFISSKIDDEAFNSLITKFRMRNFDIPINTLPETRVQSLIDCHFFEFTVQTFLEINENHPGLCEHFISRNQSSFRTISYDISLTPQFIETLMLSSNIESETKQEILNAYGAEIMTPQIAKYICSRKFEISTEVFDSAWEMLDNDDRKILMFFYLSKLDDKALFSCFSDLGGEYSDFLDRSKRHTANLNWSEDHLRLVERLKEVNYITSFQDSEVAKKDSDNPDFKQKVIRCWIKVDE